MEIRNKKIDRKRLRRAIFCIGIGTAVGLLVYGIFLYFKIDIFGWNLGLIFAPLAAGYVETILAHRIIGEDIGAISAFILFIDTTFYDVGFISFDCLFCCVTLSDMFAQGISGFVFWIAWRFL